MEMKTYIFLADGFEEIEALAPLDILRRAGIEAETVSISDEIEVVGSHGPEYILCQVDLQEEFQKYLGRKVIQKE